MAQVMAMFNAHLPACVFPLAQSDVVDSGWIDRTFSLPNYRVRLLAPTTVYVAAGGSDTTGTGTAANPWATIQHAINIVQANYDSAGNTITIQCLGSGTDPGFTMSGPLVGGGQIQVLGSNASPPFNWTLSSPSSNTVAVLNGASVFLGGFRVTAPAASSLVSWTGSTLTLGAMDFGPALYLQIAAYGATVVISADYWISGGGQCHI